MIVIVIVQVGVWSLFVGWCFIMSLLGLFLVSVGDILMNRVRLCIHNEHKVFM